MTRIITRKNPRISINQLAEYLIAGADKRRKILTQQKYPSDFLYMGKRYEEAVQTIADFVSAHEFDLSKVHNVIKRLTSAIPKDFVGEHKFASCCNALEAFSVYSETLDFLKEFDVRSGIGMYSKQQISGVEVSMRPEILFFGNDKKGKQILGCIKLYFSKKDELDEKEADYITTALRHYLIDSKGLDYQIPNDKIMVYDIFRNRIFKAPKAFVRNMKDLNAACEEIKTRWDSLPMPPPPKPKKEDKSIARSENRPPTLPNPL